ncbi:MAG: nitrous oxide-stimulated promoter family protein [Chthoniobacteraceae bacterium]
MFKMLRRMDRERRTAGLMIALYCRRHHARGGGRGAELCPACQELFDYAMLRLVRCRYQEAKTTCARCITPCYKEEMRGKIREVMRYAGPRMLLQHPVDAVCHLVDSLRRSPRSSL